MQFLNNDMDELMRRAAAGYEPSVTGADWERVEQKLDEKPPVAQPLAGNSRRYGLLVLFLLSSLVCNKYLFLNFNKWNYVNTQSIQQQQEKIEQIRPEDKEQEISSSPLVDNRLTVALSKNVSKPFYNTQSHTGSLQEKTGVLNEKRPDNKDKIDVAFEKGLQMGKTNFQAQKRISPKAPFLNLALKNTAIQIQDEPKPITEKRKSDKYFYGGVVAGLDGSTVKFRQLHTGWQGGILLGYQLNGKWAVETGVLWSKKSYYAEGQDFNTSKMKLPTHSTIIHAEGYCNMFEIPVQLKYDLVKSAQHALFATVGTSSYIMQKEEYDYLYERYNVQYYSNKYYKTSSKNWMATVNLSAGYQHKIGRASVRLEPYLKLPVQGMGVGRLPITSVGLQAGVTYPIR